MADVVRMLPAHTVEGKAHETFVQSNRKVHRNASIREIASRNAVRNSSAWVSHTALPERT